MDAASSSCQSVFDQITKLAVLLLQDELSEKERTVAIAIVPAAASVAKKRSQIYESVLRRTVLYDLAKLARPRSKRPAQFQKQLDDNCAILEAELGSYVGQCLQSICTCSEPQKSNEIKQRPIKMLLPKPLRLEKRIGEFEPPPRKYKFLPSIEEMRSAMRPSDFSRQTNFLPNNIQALSKFSKQKKNNHVSVIFNDSLARMKEAKVKKTRVQFNLPPKESCKTAEPKKKRLTKLRQTGPEKNFISDLDASNELELFANRKLKLYYVKLSHVIDDLKFLAAGLQSTTFHLTKDKTFELRPNTTLLDILPETLADFSQPFIKSGNAYQSLKARTDMLGSSKYNERPLNRSLRLAIVEIIANSRQFLLTLTAKNLPRLLYMANPVMQLLQELDKTFQVELSVNAAKGLNGSFLISYVWSAIEKSVNPEFSQLLLYLLRSLCVAYYGQLQRWIYQGNLDEPFNELFISSCTPNLFNERNKEFFDRGFVVQSDAVPGFLSGCEEVIMQCGKYNRLLKAYNWQHDVFSIKHLDLVICMSEQQFNEMRQTLEQHNEQILQNLQKPFQMQTLVDEYKANRHRFGNRMRDCTQAHIADWVQRRKALQIKADAAKMRRYDELNKQQEVQQQERLKQRRRDIVDELVFREKCAQLEEQRLQRNTQTLQDQISVLLKRNTDPIEKTAVVAISPDESTSSSRSFVSCEEANSEGLAKCKPESQTIVQDQSDVLNSNDNNNDDEMARNRMRNLCCEQFQECHIQVDMNQGATTSASTYTDAEVNRLRVLSCTEEKTQLPPDMNMNLEELSDLKRNRRRMQQHDNFNSLNSDVNGHCESSTKSITVSDNALHLPLEPNKLYVETPHDTLTPMSTTSDVEAEPFAKAIANDVIDAANNNNNNIKDSSHCDINSKSTDKPTDKPKTLQIGTTPKKVTGVAKRQPIFSLRTEDISPHIQPTNEHDPFMIKRYMQLSVMVPVKAHLSLLRNEVLRIFQDQNVFGHFCQLRNFFFLLDGEFGTQLVVGVLDQIESGVMPHTLCNRGTLDSIFNNAISHRIAEGSFESQVVDNLQLNITHIPESLDLMNLDLLSVLKLTYKVDWPLNLVISPETIAKYTQIFSHLIKLRHVNYMLERAYVHLQQLSKLNGRTMQKSAHYRNLQMVRHKLSHFVITLQNHLETTALHSTWKSFTDELRTVNSIEELYQRHVEYLKQIAFLSLLNRRSVTFRETIDKILVTVLRFCKILHSKPFVLDEEQVDFVHPRYKRLMHEEGEFEKFIRYAIYLGNKVAASGYQAQMEDLIRILNFNNYYNVSEAQIK